jgi:predicted ribosome quality control (RQC) complex YloA/Tae2 family protein
MPRNPTEPDNAEPRFRPAGDAELYRYCLPDGWEVLAGRSDRDNEQLTSKIAGPNDYWFHVRGMPGSHVVLRHRCGGDADRDLLRTAAAIAAYHSKARKGGTVSVSCTRVKHVTKPRGAKTGSVVIRKEEVLKVTPGLPDGNAP